MKEGIIVVEESSRKWKKVGIWAAWVLSGSCVALLGLTIPFVLPALRKYCLPYVPATPAQMERVLHCLKGRSGKVVDVGSGDGRVVIAAAKEGHYAVGYELNMWLVLFSKWRALLSGVHANTEFHKQDLWKVDFAQYHTIVFFGVQSMMEPLGEKISEDLRPARLKGDWSHRVIACRFPFPKQTPTASHNLGPNSVYVYDRFK